VTYLLPGPPFFAHRVSAIAGTSARAVGQPVTQNGVYRADFWHQSLQIFSHHPLAGTGFGSFGRQSRLLDPNGPHAQFVHSGFLQPLSDGGLLFGLPFLVACILVAFGLVRRLRRSADR
jgi:O-antigen ligase